MLTLYHGSNMAIDKIELACCKPHKDFGQGFYLTDIYEQAANMARRRVSIVGKGRAIVTSFGIEEQVFNDGTLNVLKFDKPTAAWAEFILLNRDIRQPDIHHSYDVVIGPVADDGVAFQLDRYLEGIITMNELVRQLTYRKLNKQYYFGTERSIACLQHFGVVQTP